MIEAGDWILPLDDDGQAQSPPVQVTRVDADAGGRRYVYPEWPDGSKTAWPADRARLAGRGRQTVDAAALPDDLKALDQWVCWRLEPARDDPSRLTKVPYMPFGARRKARSNDPATWGTFDQALKYHLLNEWVTGVGIMFAGDLAGVDLDHCVDDGGRVEPWAAAIVARLETYAELSQGGAGIHCLARGRLPAGGRRRHLVEMYDASSPRFFCVTGRHIPGAPFRVEARQAELEALHAEIFGSKPAPVAARPMPRAAPSTMPDAEPAPGAAPSTVPDAGPAPGVSPAAMPDADLLDKARAAHNGGRFAALWNGDTSGHAGDESAADLALCCMLAFWTRKDAAAIDRLFRQSGLMRPKWDRRHSADGRTYGQMTVDRAIGLTQQVYDPAAGGRGPAPSPAADGAAGGEAPAAPAAGEAGGGTPPAAQAPRAPETLADFAPWVNQSLTNHRGRWIKTQISNAIVGWAIGHDRLIFSPPTEALYFLTDEHVLLPLVDEGQALRAALSDSGLNPTEAAFKWLLEDLRSACWKNGRRGTPSHYSTIQNESVYVSCGPGRLVKGTAGRLEMLPNGTDGVYFAAEYSLPAWTPACPVEPLKLSGLSPDLEPPVEVPAYGQAVQRTLLKTWIVGLAAGLRPLPALTTIGQKDSGKSTLQRVLLAILLGPGHNVVSLPDDQRDWYAGLCGAPIVGYDNVDSGIFPRWFLDSLATAITGTDVSQRQLYTNLGQVRRPVVAAITLSSRTSSYSRPDIAERTIPIFPRALGDNRAGDSDIMRQVVDHRDGVLSWLAEKASLVACHLDQAPVSPGGRFVDFARVCWAYLKAEGDPDPDTTVRDVMRAWQAATTISISDADPLLTAIAIHLDGKGFDLTPVDLVKRLQASGADLPYFGGGKAIARRLRELKPALGMMGIGVDEYQVGTHTKFRIERNMPF